MICNMGDVISLPACFEEFAVDHQRNIIPETPITPYISQQNIQITETTSFIFIVIQIHVQNNNDESNELILLKVLAEST